MSEPNDSTPKPETTPPTPESEQGPSAEQIEAAHNEIAHAYLQAMLNLMAMTGQDEVNFCRKSLTTPDGGVYLLQFTHVSGPKISLKALIGKDMPVDYDNTPGQKT